MEDKVSPSSGCRENKDQRMRSVTVAAVQLSSGVDAAHNVDDAIALVNEAADRGATYIQLPEYFNYLGPSKGFVDVAESIPGPTTERMADVAATRKVTIHVGSLLETTPTKGKFYNTSVVMNGTGHIVATYRKIHLFDIDVPGANVQRESDAIAPGHELVLVNVANVQLGLSICFDLRFPELYRELAQSGADVLAVPAAFNAVTGRAHWEILIRSRAIENHAFVVAAAQVGTTAEGIATFGHSMIVDPWGEILAESTSSGPEVVTAVLDLDEVTNRRQQIAVMDFRRPDLYSEAVHIIDG
jgi:predicted amidohydrolase